MKREVIMPSKFEYVIVAFVWVAMIAMIVGFLTMSMVLFQLPGMFCFLGILPIAFVLLSFAFGLLASDM